MKIERFNNIATCGKIINEDNFISKVRVPAMSIDKFEKSKENICRINKVINDDYEGYASFYIDGKKDRLYFVHYDICTPDDKKKIQEDALLDGDFFLKYVDTVAKEDNNTKTILAQPTANYLNSSTNVVAEVKKDLGEGVYKVKVANFPKDIYLMLEDEDFPYAVGDKVRAYGSFEYEINKYEK